MAGEVAPKNILMIGPTGVGKTEIARRLARLTGAPFIKVEATKYTEVGYYGRDVESMVRELVENAIALVREAERKKVEPEARAPRRAAAARSARAGARGLRRRGRLRPDSPERYERTREKMRAMLAAGEMDDRKVEITIEQKAAPMMLSGMGMEQVDIDLQGMFEKILPKQTVRREMTVAEARRVLFEQECDALDQPRKSCTPQAIELAENLGIMFIDEIDKVDGQRFARGRRFAPGSAARPVADRRRDDRADEVRLRADRSHVVHRRRRFPPEQAQRSDARAARPISDSRRAAKT